MEFAPYSDLAKVYLAVADHIERHQPSVIPTPLSDSELDSFLHEYCYGSKLVNKTKLPPARVSTNNQAGQLANTVVTTTLSRPNKMEKCVATTKDREPIHGCSLSGAFNVISQIKRSQLP